MSKTDEEKDLERLDQAVRLLEHSTEYQLLVEKLKPLVASILSSREEIDKLKDFTRQSQIRFEKSGQRMRLFKEDSKTDYDSQLNTIRKAFLFLALFETTVTNILNCIVFLLVLNGHDFFIQYTRKYAKSLDDLDEANLAEKLDFLKFHGFSFLTEKINKSLRNKIAHMDFDIEEKGVIVVKKNKYDLQTEMIQLEAIVLLAANALGSAGFGNVLKEDS